ncbi:putative rRNA-processing protein EBP2 -like protein [Capsicum chinense]|nr:putative rRNA-processing protein EBP2 -like protein [Capsicum chinense]
MTILSLPRGGLGVLVHPYHYWIASTISYPYYAHEVRLRGHLRPRLIWDAHHDQGLYSGRNRHGVSPRDRSGGKSTFGKNGKGCDKKRKIREFRESKFGFGGRKGLMKQNTAETTNDFGAFHKGDRSAPKNKCAKR